MATLDISKLGAYLDKKQQDLEEGIVFAVNQVSNEIIETTPVDTGVAKGSWTPSINKMETKEINDADPKGTQALAEVSATLNRFELGDSYYLLSNLVYMPRLEYGYSKKRPQGMVRVAVDKMNSAIEEGLK